MRKRSLSLVAAISAVFVLGACSEGEPSPQAKILSSQASLRQKPSELGGNGPGSDLSLSFSSGTPSAPSEEGAKPLDSVAPSSKAFDEHVLTLKKRALEGDVEAQLGLGLRHLSGDGVERDPDLALDLFRRASNQGSREASFHLASLLVSQGQREESLKLYETLGDQGDTDGLRHAAMILAYEEDGVTLTQDAVRIEKAKSYLMKASALGDLFADAALGKLLLDQGDFSGAVAWLEKPALAGVGLAVDVLEEIAAVSPSSITDKTRKKIVEIRKTLGERA